MKLYESWRGISKGRSSRASIATASACNRCETSRQRQVSITTVLRAYLLLESRGLIKTRPNRAST